MSPASEPPRKVNKKRSGCSTTGEICRSAGGVEVAGYGLIFFAAFAFAGADMYREFGRTAKPNAPPLRHMTDGWLSDYMEIPADFMEIEMLSQYKSIAAISVGFLMVSLITLRCTSR
uniref:Uncharacterized protein n=1 Tax=Macrostomum lignano TaxID=282301 RepID=A0A1I8H7B8_9PLAT